MLVRVSSLQVVWVSSFCIMILEFENISEIVNFLFLIKSTLFFKYFFLMLIKWWLVLALRLAKTWAYSTRVSSKLVGSPSKCNGHAWPILEMIACFRFTLLCVESLVEWVHSENKTWFSSFKISFLENEFKIKFKVY